MKRDFEGKEQGFSLLELLMAVGVMAMVIVGVASIVSRQSDEAKANVVAMQMKTIGDAAGEYIKDNFTILLTNTNAPNSKVAIDLPTLRNTGYLAAGFNAVNGYGQNICVVIRRAPNPLNNPQLNNNLLGLVVTEGGNVIDDLTLGQISATIGGAGGGVYAQNPAQVTGTLGAWTFNTNVFSGATTTGTNCSGGAGNITLAAGHPTMSLWFADGASRSASGTLYRNAVAGQPELNTMNTALLTGTAAIIPDTQIGQPCNVDSATNANVPPTTRGAIGTGQDGSVVSCVNNVWTKVENKFWGAPADTIASLGICNASKLGATRMVKSTAGAAFNAHPYVPYTCDGTGAWKPIAIDQSGNLQIAGNTQINGSASVNGNLNVGSVANLYSDLNINPGSTSTGGILNLNRYMSFQNQSPSNTLGTSCTGVANGKGVTMTTDGKLLSCQNGVWALATTQAVGTTLYLYGNASYGGQQPTNCPLGWTDAGMGITLGGGGVNLTRSCVNTGLQCQTVYLYGNATFGGQQPTNCPSGWTDAGMGITLGGGGVNLTRSCVKCQ